MLPTATQRCSNLRTWGFLIPLALAFALLCAAAQLYLHGAKIRALEERLDRIERKVEHVERQGMLERRSFEIKQRDIIDILQREYPEFNPPQNNPLLYKEGREGG